MKINKPWGKISFLLFYLFFFLASTVQSQLINNGDTIAVTNGAILFTDQSFTNTSNGFVINNGTMSTNGDFINDASCSLSGDGTYGLQGNFMNNGNYKVGQSVLYFFGANNSTITNAGGSIYTLQIGKDQGNYVSILDNEKIVKSVLFLNDKNWVQLNNKTLTLSSKCDIGNYSNKRYFITNGNGYLKKQMVKNSPFSFPVGFDKNTYNPLVITETGTADDYSVRCLQHAMLQGATGDTISSGGINASWDITEGNTGGANAIIQAEWKNTDELSNFDYTHCMLVRYNGSKWDFTAGQADTATGITYRDISRANLSSFGYFTVLSEKNPAFAANYVAGIKIDKTLTGSMNNDKDNFKIYPTIVKNSFNIIAPVNNKNVQTMNIILINEAGKVVWQKQNVNFQSQQVSLPNLSAGLYSVLIDYKINRFVQKIIIQQ